MSVPNAPTLNSANFDAGPQNFTITWSAPTTPPNITYYNLYINDVSQNVGLALFYILPLTVQNSGTFNFKVTAVNGSGESAPQ